MFGKTAVLEVLENSQKNVSSSAPCKQSELPIPPTYNYTKNWLHRKYLTRNFKIDGRACNHILIK